ncbi:hypothetical protein MMMDOFMJ_4472 [Methylobacterium gnaphalii]|nr:hypothetical protein MMMDOFMJ_4472 [Methylobacterium gnaphalii]
MDGFAHATQPALVVREHAHGLQHLAGFARADAVSPLNELIDGRANILDRRLEALDLELDALGDQALHHDARLMQHDVAEADAIGERHAALADRTTSGAAGAGGERLQLAGSDHLREHHGGGLERLDLLVGIDAVGLVLDDEHAERVASAEKRHAEEGVVDLFPGLGPIGEVRVRLRVRERERLGLPRDQADEAFIGAQPRDVHGIAVQALGREQLERVVVAQDIDRTNLGDDVGSDEDNDAVEACLCADRLRHCFAEPAQQQARASGRSGHRVVNPCSADATTKRAGCRGSGTSRCGEYGQA